MPGHARQMPSPRPAAIAGHNDCDVLREPRRIKPPVSFRLFAIQPGRNRRLQRNLFRLLKLTHSLGERNDAKVTGSSGGSRPVFAEGLSQREREVTGPRPRQGTAYRSTPSSANNETRRGGRPRPPSELARTVEDVDQLSYSASGFADRAANRGGSECHYPWMHAQSEMSPLSVAQAASSLALMRTRCAGASARFCRIAEKSSYTLATWHSLTALAWGLWLAC